MHLAGFTDYFFPLISHGCRWSLVAPGDRWGEWLLTNRLSAWYKDFMAEQPRQNVSIRKEILSQVQVQAASRGKSLRSTVEDILTKAVGATADPKPKKQAATPDPSSNKTIPCPFCSLRTPFTGAGYDNHLKFIHHLQPALILPEEDTIEAKVIDD